jgi:uncharacterized membrane protein YoaK (UPF0700 family)
MQVTLHTPDTIYSPRHVPSWLLLAWAAGTVNGVAFLMCEQFVTHVTGTITRLGLEWLAAGLVVEYAAVVVSFVAGATASVIAIQARAWQGKQPRWATPLVSVAVILAGVAVTGHIGAFGRFGGTLAARRRSPSCRYWRSRWACRTRPSPRQPGWPCGPRT